MTTQPTSSQAFSLFRNPSLTSGFPWWSSNWDSTPPLLGAQVRSLIRELRSQKSLSSAAKKKKNLPKAQTLHGWVGGWCLNSSLWFQERWICRVENRASFHRHFLSTYCVPTPSTNVCTSERRPWAVRGSQLWREGSHHSGGRTYTFPEEVLFGQSWRVVGAVLGVRQGKPGEGGVESARGRTAGTLTWINRHGGGRRRRQSSVKSKHSYLPVPGRAGSPLPAARKGRGTKANGNLSMHLTGTRRRRDSPPYHAIGKWAPAHSACMWRFGRG